MKNAGGIINIMIKVYKRNYKASLLILSGCFIMPYANLNLNVLSRDKTFRYSAI